MARAVFLDRDGTINVNQPEYIHKIEDFRFTPKAVEALQKLSETDYKLIIITNQSGIARGHYKEQDMRILHTWMLQEMKGKDIRIDDIYHCPHGPQDNCACRKPKPGMALKAAQDFNIDLSKSWMIGDDDRDIIMAENAGVKAIKIGKSDNADFCAKDLLQAVNFILASS